MVRIKRTENTVKGVLWGFLNKVITLFLPFVIRTTVIRVFGVEYGGLNGLFSSLLQVLNLAELGFSNAVVYSMYKPIAENDNKKLCALLNYYKKIYRNIGIFISLAGLLILPFVNFFIKGTPPEGVNIYIIYLIYLANTASSYLFFAYKTTLLNAYQRTDLIHRINLAVHLAQNVLQIACILILKNFYIYLVVALVANIVNNYLYKIKADKDYPNLQCIGEIDSSQKNEIHHHVSGLMISKLCNVSRNSFDTIAISSFIGLAATSIYSNYYYIFSSISGFFTVLLTSMSAGIGNSIATDSQEKNYADMRMLTFMFMWISSWSTCCLICLYQPFMTVWMGKDLLLPFHCVVALCVYFFLLRLGDIRSHYFDACGLWWYGKKYVLFEAIMNLLLNFVFGYIFGVFGVIFATIITVLFINNTFLTKVLFEHYFTDCSIYKYVAEYAKISLTTIIVCTLCYYICNICYIGGVAEVFKRAVICLLFPNFLFWLSYQKSDEYKMSRMFFNRFLKRQ